MISSDGIALLLLHDSSSNPLNNRRTDGVPKHSPPCLYIRAIRPTVRKSHRPFVFQRTQAPYALLGNDVRLRVGMNAPLVRGQSWNQLAGLAPSVSGNSRLEYERLKTSVRMSGKDWPFFRAFAKIRLHAVCVKKNSGGCVPLSKMSDNEQARPALGEPKMSSVKTPPGKHIPAFRQTVEDGEHIPSIV
jgi:hypothetical protein